ncbi:hypothetical protein ACE6H2_008076 [Prunus campanulata]
MMLFEHKRLGERGLHKYSLGVGISNLFPHGGGGIARSTKLYLTGSLYKTLIFGHYRYKIHLLLKNEHHVQKVSESYFSFPL